SQLGSSCCEWTYRSLSETSSLPMSAAMQQQKNMITACSASCWTYRLTIGYSTGPYRIRYRTPAPAGTPTKKVNQLTNDPRCIVSLLVRMGRLMVSVSIQGITVVSSAGDGVNFDDFDAQPPT